MERRLTQRQESVDNMDHSKGRMGWGKQLRGVDRRAVMEGSRIMRMRVGRLARAHGFPVGGQSILLNERRPNGGSSILGY